VVKEPFKRGKATDVQWSDTVTVPIDEAEACLYFGEDKDRTTLLDLGWKAVKVLFHAALSASGLFWLLINAFLLVWTPEGSEPIGFGIGLTNVILGLICSLYFSYHLHGSLRTVRKLHRVNAGKPIEVQAGKHYDLSWSPRGARLVAKER
jgi:hypothetical protein